MIREQFDLSEKVALVVGGRGFLGRRFSAALAEFGAHVIAADLSEDSLAVKQDPTAPSLTGIEQRVVDVTDVEVVQSLVDGIVAETSRIDALIYCATAKPKDFYKPFTECSLEGWRSLLQVELDGLFLTTQQVGRIMESKGSGSMVLLSSIYGLVGNDQRIYEGTNLAELYVGDTSREAKQIYAHAGYAAAKGAVISLTRFLAAYWGEHGIRVNCISPGGLAHPGESEDFVRKYSERVPLGRKAGLDEVSGAVVFLASDASSYVTGHNLVVDGGWTAW
ncbi:MAG: SDR family oxidoreductase [Anaerolineales bacterium]|jgi:NAD(P)-dependent dehydrogenase (short-subunit alcohol dehydrogenase family)